MKLRDIVTSPGGTSIAGVYVLERDGLTATPIDAVEAATKRSQELGARRRIRYTKDSCLRDMNNLAKNP